jgi:hypothetical protein
VARFGNADEHADRETVHYVFTYADALDQLIRRTGTSSDSNATAIRGVPAQSDGTLLTRDLNVPPPRVPGEGWNASTTCQPIQKRPLRGFGRDRWFDDRAGNDCSRLLRRCRHRVKPSRPRFQPSDLAPNSARGSV